jgi:hypothetical protein
MQRAVSLHLCRSAPFYFVFLALFAVGFDRTEIEHGGTETQCHGGKGAEMQRGAWPFLCERQGVSVLLASAP